MVSGNPGVAGRHRRRLPACRRALAGRADRRPEERLGLHPGLGAGRAGVGAAPARPGGASGARPGRRAGAGETHARLDRVAALAGNLPTPDRPEHHYRYDPAKADAYTATTLAW